MRKIFRNRYGAASPLEFSIASVALISTIVVVTGAMAPPVEQSAAQFHADASAKATEIMSLLLSSESDIGLAVDPGTSIPIPPTESITDVTIENSFPGASLISPLDGLPYTIRDQEQVNLEIWVTDPDGDELIVMFFFGVEGFNRQLRCEYSQTPGYILCQTPPLSIGITYEWNVSVSDSTRTFESPIWSFTTIFPNLGPNTPDRPACCITPQGCVVCNRVGQQCCFQTFTIDPEGDNVYYMWDWDDGTSLVWDGPFPHNTIQQGNHIWALSGIYNVRVKAKDVYGSESSWSQPLQWTIIGGFGHCFLEETQILMYDGSYKNIEEIKIDDKVLAFDEKTKSFKKDRVVQIYHDTADMMVSDSYILINNNLRVTPDHNLYINNKWINAGDINLGDSFFIGKVKSIETIKNRVPTYNFETDKYNTYLVKFGNNMVISHNDVRYVFAGNEEQVSYNRKTSATENDYSALLDIEKIFALSEKPYSVVREKLKVSEDYNFYFIISNDESVFLNYIPDPALVIHNDHVIRTVTENVIIVDNVGYAYAKLQVTVVK